MTARRPEAARGFTQASSVMPGARFSEELGGTVSHELRPLKRTPRPKRPLTRRTSRPTAPFFRPDASPNLMPFESASLKP